MRYKTKARDCRLLVRAKASFGESIDEKALDAFSRVFLRGFLRAKLIKKNVVEYSGPIGISLYERLKNPISKRDFLFIMEQLVLAIQKVEGNNLQMCHVVLDLQNVYINDVTKEVQFLYVPLIKGNNSSDIMSFVESVVYSVIPTDEKDSEFISRFIHYIKSQESFAPDAVEKYIAKEDRSVVNTIKKQNAGQSGFMTSKPQHYYEHYDGQGQDSGEEAGESKQEPASVNTQKRDADQPNNTKTSSTYSRAGDTASSKAMNRTFVEEATGVLDEEATGVLDEEATGVLDEDATGVLGEETTGVLVEEETGLLEENETGLLEEEGTMLLQEQPPIIYPTLFRVLNEETISINKPVFRLGKERSYVDYFVTNNNAVSRSHADIITRGNKYFVIDLNSKNHTYINDQMIAVQCETEIRDGDRLKLGNEEFVFQIKSKNPANVCRRCGKKIEHKGNFCIHCGSRIE